MTSSRNVPLDNVVFAMFRYNTQATPLHLLATEEVIRAGMENVGHPVASQTRVGVSYRLVDEHMVDQIATTVHTAWMAEKQRQGFADHPYYSRIEHVALMPDGTFDPSIVACCSKPRSLHHMNMVSYDQLDEAVTEDARVTVRTVLNALLMGEEVHDA